MTFAQQYTPEFPAELVVTDWLSRFYSGDNGVIIAVDLNTDYQITAHALVIISEAYGNRVCMVPQLQDDTRKGVFLDDVFELVDKLVAQRNCTCSEILVHKGVKALEKKYGYTVSRTVMLKYPQEGTV